MSLSPRRSCDPRQYAAAGVDLGGAEAAKERIGELVASTRTALSTGKVGAFGGMVRVPAGMRKPTLVLSTDGVGTKVLVALQAGRFDTVGEDLVNHSVNDILVHGAVPIAFMDYIAGSGLDGRADRRHRRGHRARVPGSRNGAGRRRDRADAGPLSARDVSTSPARSSVSSKRIDALHGDAIVPGDVLLGYASTGLHTNGYTLARRIVFDRMRLELEDLLGDTRQTVADALLAVHRSYYRSVAPVLDRVHGLAHITGGGIPGNLVRILPADCEALVDPDAWELPPLFLTLQQAGHVSIEEMRDVFNLGVGLIAVLPRDAVAGAQSAARTGGVATWVIGEIRRGPSSVRFARS